LRELVVDDKRQVILGYYALFANNWVAEYTHNSSSLT